MPHIWRNYLARVLMVLGGFTLVGALYDRADAGLLVGAIVVLVWHVRKLLQFERSLGTEDFSQFRAGEGIWQHI